MTDLTSTLASLQRLAEDTGRAVDTAVEMNTPSGYELLGRLLAKKLRPSAVLALVEVARAAEEWALTYADTEEEAVAESNILGALTRLSALSPKGGE